MSEILIKKSSKKDIISNDLLFYYNKKYSPVDVVDGKVAAVYDVRDQNKENSPMKQDDPAKRPIFHEVGLVFIEFNLSLEMAIEPQELHPFIVINADLGQNASVIKFINEGIRFQVLKPYCHNRSEHYINGIKYPKQDSNTFGLRLERNKTYIISPLNTTNATILKLSGTYIQNAVVLAFGAYRRQLSEFEILKNMAALNAEFDLY